MKEKLLSTGIDIGTSTTQLVFSEITVENKASAYSVPRVEIADKKVIYRSDIYFTPLVSQTEIDMEGVKKIIESEYKKAGVDKKDINTGAVIITGETARKENAAAVAEFMSGYAGDFVVATAGPDLESIISGKGAGADVFSKNNRAKVVNIDIGGGTSNFAVFSGGEAVDTGCMDIGGRLIKIKEGAVTYIAPKIQEIIRLKNLSIKTGGIAYEAELEKIADIMVHALMQALGLEEKDEIFSLLITNKTISQKADYVSFSGGVADYVYSETKGERFKFGDIGIILGEAIRKSAILKEMKLVRSAETIRATVVGAGAHTTEISGSTITYTKNLFPIKNIPIIKLTEEEEKNIPESLGKKLKWFDEKRVAVAFKGIKSPSFAKLCEYAKGLSRFKELSPLIVIVENDMAKALGQALYGKTEGEVICLDSIKLENGDYIDIGNPIAEGTALPVVVKTLVFN